MSFLHNKNMHPPLMLRWGDVVKTSSSRTKTRKNSKCRCGGSWNKKVLNNDNIITPGSTVPGLRSGFCCSVTTRPMGDADTVLRGVDLATGLCGTDAWTLREAPLGVAPRAGELGPDSMARLEPPKITLLVLINQYPKGSQMWRDIEVHIKLRWWGNVALAEHDNMLIEDVTAF